MTRDDLLRALEERLTETLEEHGIRATVLAAPSTAGTLPLSVSGVGADGLPQEVLSAIEDTVRCFVDAHGDELAELFTQPVDRRLLN